VSSVPINSGYSFIKIVANKIANYTGYTPIKTEKSTGGYSDWVSLTKRVPAYTIEVGSDDLSHPIDLTQLPKIYEQNKRVPIVAFDALQEYNTLK
jgi:hypothetical protein